MIDCPICNVPNNDDARFCAECGQRLGQPAAKPEPSRVAESAPAVEIQAAKPEKPPDRLHSPLLEGAGFQEPVADTGDRDRSGKMSERQPENAGAPVQRFRADSSPAQGTAGPQRKLRSPLLAQEEFDEDEISLTDAPPAQKRSGLRSPLLAGDEPDGAVPESIQRGGRMRSPAFPERADPAPAQSNSLIPQPKGQAAGPVPTRGRGLRSPILGGGAAEFDDNDYYDDDEDPFADEDNPDVLRSPLLAAKRPRGGGVLPGRKSPVPPGQPVPPAPGAGQLHRPASAQLEGEHPAPSPGGPAVSSPSGAAERFATHDSPFLPAKSAGAAPAGGPTPLAAPAGTPSFDRSQRPVQSPAAQSPAAPPPAGSSAEPYQTHDSAAQRTGTSGPPVDMDSSRQRFYSRVEPPAPAGSLTPGTATPAQFSMDEPVPQSPIMPNASGQQPPAPASPGPADPPLADNRFHGTGSWYGRQPDRAPAQQQATPEPATQLFSDTPAWFSDGSALGTAAGQQTSPFEQTPSPEGRPAQAAAARRADVFPEEDYAAMRRQPEPQATPPAPVPSQAGNPPPTLSADNVKSPLTPEPPQQRNTAPAVRTIKRSGSRLLSNIAEEMESKEEAPLNYGGQAATPPGTALPVVYKVVGGMLSVALMMKLYAIISYTGTESWAYMPFVFDQFSAVVALLALTVYCFFPRG